MWTTTPVLTWYVLACLITYPATLAALVCAVVFLCVVGIGLCVYPLQAPESTH